MLNNNTLGTISELKAFIWFTEHGFSVFSSYDGKAPFDLVVVKDSNLYRVEVKSGDKLSPSGTGVRIGLRSTRFNTKEVTNKNFDSSKSDIVFMYAYPIDKFIVDWSINYEGRSEKTISLNSCSVNNLDL